MSTPYPDIPKCCLGSHLTGFGDVAHVQSQQSVQASKFCMLIVVEPWNESAFKQFSLYSGDNDIWLSLFLFLSALVCDSKSIIDVKLNSKKIPCPLFIILNHFLQISQDQDYWAHLSCALSETRQRWIAPAWRFKDFPTPSDTNWQSLILLNANCPLSPPRRHVHPHKCGRVHAHIFWNTR